MSAQYFIQYLQLIFFKTSLEELPKSVPLLRTALIVYMLLEFFIQINIGGDPVQAFIETVVETLLTFVFVVLMLLKARKGYLFFQTYTAFLITENLLFSAVSPILFWLDILNNLLTIYVTFSVITLLCIWCLSVLSFLVRQVFEISKLASYLIAFSYLSVTYVGTFVLTSF